MSIRKLFPALILLISLAGCRKKDLPEPAKLNGSITIKLNNTVGNIPLTLGKSSDYTLSNGESFTVSSYNYYLTNFVFTDENGNTFVEPESYHLVMANDPASLGFTVQNVPFSKFKFIEFLIGVDSLRNFSGIQSGDLDPKYGMFWSWSSGYVMARLEGSSPQSASPAGDISFHIGGYKGVYNVIQKVRIPLPQMAEVTKDISPVITLQSDASKWFRSSGFEPFSFSKTFSVVTDGQEAFQISQNYSSMFSLLSVEN